MKNFNLLFGKEIRKARKANNLNQEEAAHRADVSLSTYQRMELGDGDSLHRNVYKVARTLHIKLDPIYEKISNELDFHPNDD